jgi:hypothetical protein
LQQISVEDSTLFALQLRSILIDLLVCQHLDLPIEQTDYAEPYDHENTMLGMVKQTKDGEEKLVPLIVFETEEARNMLFDQFKLGEGEKAKLKEIIKVEGEVSEEITDEMWKTMPIPPDMQFSV